MLRVEFMRRPLRNTTGSGRSLLNILAVVFATVFASSVPAARAADGDIEGSVAIYLQGASLLPGHRSLDRLLMTTARSFHHQVRKSGVDVVSSRHHTVRNGEPCGSMWTLFTRSFGLPTRPVDADCADLRDPDLGYANPLVLTSSVWIDLRSGEPVLTHHVLWATLDFNLRGGGFHSLGDDRVVIGIGLPLGVGEGPVTSGPALVRRVRSLYQRSLDAMFEDFEANGYPWDREAGTRFRRD